MPRSAEELERPPTLRRPPLLLPFLKLPPPWTLERAREHCPPIAPVAGGSGARPFWSVMIPAYNAGGYLRRTLRSVLSQDPGPGRMQIEVVDCGSTEDDPRVAVEEVGRDRVSFFRLDANRGAAHSFTTCVNRSRGKWVHILHGDDMSGPGFYEGYEAVIEGNPEAGMVGGPATQIDEEDRVIGRYGPEPAGRSGLMPDFVERQAVRQLLLFNAVVARREVYEAAGGFCTLFDHVCDWDMWFRLGLEAPVAWVDRPLALYREHRGSDTNRQRVTGANIRESYLMVESNLARLREMDLPIPATDWRADLAEQADGLCRTFRRLGRWDGAYHQARWAMMLEPRRWRLRIVAEAWLHYRLGGRQR